MAMLTTKGLLLLLALLAGAAVALWNATKAAAAQSPAAEGKNDLDAEVKPLTKDNYKSEVEESLQPVLIDFYATWCGPCKRMAPLVEQLATEYKGKLKVLKVNVDEQPELVAQYGIDGYPTLVIVRPGNQATHKSVGYKDISLLRKFIDNALSAR